MPGIIGLNTLDISTDYFSGGGAILDTNRTYTVVANDVLESGFFYCRGTSSGSDSLTLGLYNRTNGDALITTVPITIADKSVEGWTEVSIGLDLTPYVGNELAIAITAPDSFIPTFRSGDLNNSVSASQTLDDPFVTNTTDGRMYAGYFNVVAGSTVDATIRKGAAGFTQAHGLGTITTATLNAQAITIASQVAGTVTLDETSGITNSGVYDLVLGDGATTETYSYQLNVVGLAPSNNPVQVDGAAQASLTDVQVRISAGATLSGTEYYYTGTATTDASGNLASVDLSATAAALGESVLLQVMTAAGESITAVETVEAI